MSKFNVDTLDRECGIASFRKYAHTLFVSQAICAGNQKAVTATREKKKKKKNILYRTVFFTIVLGLDLYSTGALIPAVLLAKKA